MGLAGTGNPEKQLRNMQVADVEGGDGAGRAQGDVCAEEETTTNEPGATNEGAEDERWSVELEEF